VTRVGMEGSGNFGWPAAIYLLEQDPERRRGAGVSELQRFADPAEAAIPRSTPSGETHVDNVIRPAATRTGLAAATAFGPSR
jgi:hypothetical protein